MTEITNTKNAMLLIEQYGWGTLGTHDPTIVKEENDYYMFSTDTAVNNSPTKGIQIRKSKDLVHWEYVGTALNNIPNEAFEWSKAQGLWAPDVIKYNGVYYMYYSASTFGSTVSCIGLAKATHLQGPWQDEGIVVKTAPSIATHNAIDANVVKDKEENYWLCYGSFFGGIHLVRLNMETGFPEKENDYGKLIARRPQAVEGAIEGAFIYYHEATDFYYLFASYDSLSDSYNIRVARSKNITGPYIDKNGKNMIDTEGAPHSIGVKLVGSYQFKNDIAWIAPGHNSIFADNQKLYMVHHVRVEAFSSYHYAYIRELFWLEKGWPVVSPEHYQRTNEHTYSANDLLGEWEWIAFDEDTNLKESKIVNVRDTDLYAIQAIANNQFQHMVEDFQFVVFPCMDWKQNKKTIGFSGLTREGRAIFGKRV